MPQRNTLKKAERLKSRKRIDLLFKKGKSFSVFPYKVFYLVTTAGPSEATGQGATAPNPSADTPASSSGRISPASLSSGHGPLPPASLQTGFAVSSRHFKKAVDRNRIKRLGREAWRLQKHPLDDVLGKKGLRMELFFVFIGKDLPDYPMITARIGVILQKLIKENA
ncbi:MAG TPA: ribonuclease P protein component [Puia sp.]|nr:ribonuclease P protein component [Puia sp.]